MTATRTPQPIATIGSAVDVLTADDVARMQLPLLRDALALVPGAPALASGAPGSVTSVFLRGANSNQTLFLVDGIRSNDANTDYAVTLGGSALESGDRLEVARGPQSTLYGADAIGGVVALQGATGKGPTSGSISAEAGSFGTVDGAISAQGGDGSGGWSFSASGGHTDNDRPNNSLDQLSTALRVERVVSPSVAIGATWRGFIDRFGDPGDRYTNDPDNVDRESNQLVTAFADLGRGSVLTSHVIVGAQDRRFVADEPGPFGDDTTVVKNRRLVADWQSTYSGWDRQRLTVGATGEINHTVNTGFGDIDHHESLLAVFAEDEWNPVRGLRLTGGLRHDQFDTFGGATTGRVTAAWLTADNRWKFRSSYGTGFRAPGFLDLYGQSSFYVGNPNLRPETARGGDAGVDYFLAGNRGVLSASVFRTDLSNLITYDFASFPSTVVNVERARTQGVEFSAQIDLRGFKLRASYAYLDARNLSEDNRLLRRPRHSGALDAWRELGGGFSAGFGLAFAADREDVDALTFATIAQPGYTVARLYGRWQATRHFALKARIENLLDRKYEVVNGYPALGLGAYGGVEWTF
ncbi:MAG TPA: TonB-dependent receptor [Candidatus Didemnitutus sp.]|nr:TonB-dependent receptor [Candidatus Didemnitutus sp.]